MLSLVIMTEVMSYMYKILSEYLYMMPVASSIIKLQEVKQMSILFFPSPELSSYLENHLILTKEILSISEVDNL